ncbi:hypothetical protein Vadar_003715 [Vaccinium darrowii]|uniref:Uncharacterized protein n=1 Tax=Vaccinium darrowii TaxID=229202 RepID=A0ACB7X7C8_9ERIC|nr:hypothetical protein Vadar_003715 [Vaccinium darrowii]
MRSAAPGAERVPPACPQGSAAGGGLPPPEPIAGGVPGGGGLPHRIGGRSEPLFKRWHRSEAVPVSASPALPLRLSLFPPNPFLILNPNLTRIRMSSPLYLRCRSVLLFSHRSEDLL